MHASIRCVFHRASGRSREVDYLNVDRSHVSYNALRSFVESWTTYCTEIFPSKWIYFISYVSLPFNKVIVFSRMLSINCGFSLSLEFSYLYTTPYIFYSTRDTFFKALAILREFYIMSHIAIVSKKIALDRHRSERSVNCNGGCYISRKKTGLTIVDLAIERSQRQLTGRCLRIKRATPA